jgi:hypothetical protein
MQGQGERCRDERQYGNSREDRIDGGVDQGKDAEIESGVEERKAEIMERDLPLC